MADNLVIREATTEDASTLADMNWQLIRDEGHSNPSTIPQLAERMAGWLESAYSALIVEAAGDPTVYGLWRDDGDIYIRQWFVCKGYRWAGLGRKLLDHARATFWAGRHLRIECLSGNTGGLAFWRGVGFRDYCITMTSDP